MASSNLVGHPVVVSMRLISGEQDLEVGRLTHALQAFSYVEDELINHPESGPENEVLHRAMLQAAQYGVAASLLAMRRLDLAKRAASKALEGSFVRQADDPHDKRRYFLTLLSNAKTREDYARAWGNIL